ncbi:MAG: type IV secretion system protein [Alphaproteobacteria bacterium]|nr:type IV secretion system protein [Alphaproteobacteria bacterium]
MEPAEQQDVAQKIASGEYYRDAREWYSALYISPIAERGVFLLMSGFAALVLLFGALGFMDLLPIVARDRIIITNQRMDETKTSISPLRAQGKSTNVSLKQFYAASYVYMRERYRAADYAKNLAFVEAHSDPATLQYFLETQGPENPDSYAVRLGAVGERTVEITGVSINNKVQPPIATVQFVTDFKNVTGGSRTAWTATLSFYYTKVSLTEVVNPSTGKSRLKIVDPAFNVVSYSVVRNR